MKKIFTAATVSFLILVSVPFYAQAQNPPTPGVNGPTQASALGLPYTSSTASPSGISACGTLSTGGFASVAQCAIGILNTIIPVIVALTVIYVIWGAFGLTRSDGEDRKKYRDIILYGILGLFIMVSIYGLVNILTGTFPGLTGGGLPSVQVNLK